MPRIKPEDKTPIEVLSVRLRSDIITKVHAYAKFLNDSSTSYVVSAALSETFDSDKDFAKWLAENPNVLTVCKRPTPKRGRPGTQLSVA